MLIKSTLISSCTSDKIYTNEDYKFKNYSFLETCFMMENMIIKR